MERRRRKSRERGSAFRGKVKRNVDKSKQEASQYGYLKLPTGISMFTVTTPGRVKLDILPYKVKDPKHPDREDEFGVAVPGSLWYKRPFKVHKSVGVDNARVICPTSVGKACPICEYRSKRMKEGADKEELKSLKPTMRELYVVVPKDHPKLEEKPHLWDMSHYLFQKLLNEEIDECDDYEIFPDLKEGLTLRIRFAEESMGAYSFVEARKIDFEERDYEYDEDILDKIPNPDEIIQNSVLPASEIQQMFFDVPEPEDIAEDSAVVDDEEDDIPDIGSLTKPKTVAEDDDEEEPEPESEPEPKDEPKEEKRPRRRSRPQKAPSEKCPFGHEFGVDADKYDDCYDCQLWDECIEEADK